MTPARGGDARLFAVYGLAATGDDDTKGPREDRA